MLQLAGVSKHFGGVTALRQANFSLHAGEVHALIGENGAGKSTLSKIIAGAERADSGTINLDGQSVVIQSPLDAQRLGIGMIHQELDLFPHLSVGENIAAGNLAMRERFLVGRRRLEKFCRPFLDQVGLGCTTGTIVADLPIAHMQLLAIARALSMNVRILLMDEPTSTLSQDAVERLFGLIRTLKEQGVAIVYVSHKMEELFQICDRATVLRDGQTIQTLEIAKTTPAEIVRLMVGRDLQLDGPAGPHTPGEVVLMVDRLTTRKLRAVSFELHRGEVLGVAGLVGAGRSELGAALFGRHAITSGTLQLNGATIVPRSTRDAIRQGIGLVPEDRRLDGLMMNMSVLENGVMAVLPRMQKSGFLRHGREQGEFNGAAAQMALQCHSPEAPVSTLSGGNQQKVLLARWLLVRPQVLFLDDPTRGIDIAAKRDIYRVIDQLASEGTAVIFVSSELPELLRCCDRILVMRNGAVAAAFDARAATQDRIMTAATGAA